jgi:hypothetical protein
MKCKVKIAKCKFCRGTVTVPLLLNKGARDYRQHLNVIARHGFDRLADVGQPTLLKKGACNDRKSIVVGLRCWFRPSSVRPELVERRNRSLRALIEFSLNRQVLLRALDSLNIKNAT